MTDEPPVLDIYLDNNPIAQLTNINAEIYWHYAESWQKSGYPVSPHLPFHTAIPAINVQRFLRNLLPEGERLGELLHYFRLRGTNTFGLIQSLGLDLSGSLIILSAEQQLPQESVFRVITDKELDEHLTKRDEFSLIMWDGKPRLSVAGVQDKINVMLNAEKELGFAEGKACSTHILKFEKQKLPHLVLNEFFSMRLAKLCGLKVAEVALHKCGEHNALLVKRFDREFITVNDVKRHHVIDGCQALNLASEYKYERNFGSGRDVAHIREGASLSKLFNFANQCENPALTKQQMLDWVLFNLLIFNYDAHGKNISFFVDADGIKLTPFYDLVNIGLYPQFEHEMAMALGDEFDSNKIYSYQLADFAESCHLPRALVKDRLNYLTKKMILAIESMTKKMDYIIQPDTYQENEDYLFQYQTNVYKRCQHFQQQAKEITLINL